MGTFYFLLVCKSYFAKRQDATSAHAIIRMQMDMDIRGTLRLSVYITVGDYTDALEEIKPERLLGSRVPAFRAIDQCLHRGVA